jgi:hypothetical protein
MVPLPDLPLARMRLDHIVPFTMEFAGIDMKLFHLFGCDLASDGVFAAIQPAGLA